uniref:Uncharacterized protein n=1 Tax=viral metagenome TaxID=1070528 RepID=A0A6C0EUF1_9ZZZZ
MLYVSYQIFLIQESYSILLNNIFIHYNAKKNIKNIKYIKIYVSLFLASFL